MTTAQATEQLSYEIRTRRAGRWEIREIVDDPLSLLPAGCRANATSADLRRAEVLIKEKARCFLSGAGIEAVRVTRTRGRDGETMTETAIFSEERDLRGTAPTIPLTVGTLDGPVTPCESVDELCQRGGYHMAGLLLRSFLEKSGITAFELFHHPGHQQALSEARGLVPGAIERVVKLQAGGDGRVLAARKECLAGLVRDLSSRARGVAALQLPLLAAGAFEKMADIAVSLGAPETARFRVGAALSRSLARTAGMAHRLNVVVRCLATPMEPWMHGLLDVFLAGVFDDTSATAKLLPGSRDRAAMMVFLADLAEGRALPSGADPMAAVLALLIARGVLPHTKASLWERITRDVDRNEPLSQFEPRLEREKLGATRGKILPMAPEAVRSRLESGLRRRSEALRQSALDSAFG